MRGGRKRPHKRGMIGHIKERPHERETDAI
jgi:hypothetical protein